MGLSEKQLEILRWPYTGRRALICDGAVRSGKTFALSVSFFCGPWPGFSGKIRALRGVHRGGAAESAGPGEAGNPGAGLPVGGEGQQNEVVVRGGDGRTYFTCTAAGTREASPPSRG